MMLMGPVWNIGNSFSELQRSLAAMERVFEILGLPADKPDRPGAVTAPDVVSELRFEDVEFGQRRCTDPLEPADVIVQLVPSDLTGLALSQSH
jgi:ATP-binding cassette subfamily B protein